MDQLRSLVVSRIAELQLLYDQDEYTLMLEDSVQAEAESRNTTHSGVMVVYRDDTVSNRWGARVDPRHDSWTNMLNRDRRFSTVFAGSLRLSLKSELLRIELEITRLKRMSDIWSTVLNIS
jgi:hypothetical protein